MHPVDAALIVAYFLGILGVGLWFLRRNRDADDYYVGGRTMGSTHIGLSVVATDVGGGFSIGLGGLGFAIGLSGSWMLFTGLLGAYLAAVLLVPRVHALGVKHGLSTYPQVFGVRYGTHVAMAAAVLSAIGYMGFTASQLLAGAKLASATIAGLDVGTALLAMGVLAVLYTALGGMKAVIYTDTVQWILLLVGLIFIGIPVCYQALGGLEGIRANVPAGHLRLDRIEPVQAVNWTFAILPIWFVGMTLYQRIYACRDARTARRAWYLAGLFEWPVMAFLGVVLGLLGRVAWQQGVFAGDGFAPAAAMDRELGLPLLLKNLLPVGLKGIMLAAYFSAILSTADSCLMAASGNLATDLFPGRRTRSGRSVLFRSQIFTLAIGALALLLASTMTNVLELMLYAYGFMVSGLLVPTVAAFALRHPSPRAALAAMIGGGGTTTLVAYLAQRAQQDPPLGLDPAVFGTAVALVVFVALQRRWERSSSPAAADPESAASG